MEQSSNSIPAGRQQKITKFLSGNGSISIREAAELCNVSEATARRDLDEMALIGLVERTHGGAILHRSTGFEFSHKEKMRVMISEKLKIAKAALGLIHDGDSIFLDSGTTVFTLAEQLISMRRLTVVTNSLDIAYTTRLDPSSTMVVTGGIRRDGYNMLVGDIGENLIKELYVDIAFLGADAIDIRNGVFNSNFAEIGIKRGVLGNSKKRVLLADHQKFTQKALVKVCGIEAFDCIITDTGIAEELQTILEEKVPHVITA